MKGSMLRFVARCVLLAIALIQTGCRSSLDADALIANTLDGRAGEIRSMLRDDLSATDKAMLGAYFARIEPPFAEGRGLLGETQALAYTSRSTPGATSDIHRQLAARWQRLADQLGAVEPPSQMAQSHAAIGRAFASLATASEVYASAVDAAKIEQLKVAGERRGAALGAARAALDDLEGQANEYLAVGKRLRLR